MLIPRKLYFSVRGERQRVRTSHRAPGLRSAVRMEATFTHVEGDGDDVEAHGGVGDAAEGRRLKRQEQSRAHVTAAPVAASSFQPVRRRLPKLLTRSILASLCLRRRRLCLRINCEEELCSVELLSLKKGKREESKSADRAAPRFCRFKKRKKERKKIPFDVRSEFTCSHPRPRRCR